ncbi:molybdopterin-dependent oxidoreductase [candidate division KSB1 bacterium]
MQVFTTACPRNCYSTCTIKVSIEDGKIRKIEPHLLNKATAEGPCLKGLSYIERVYSPKRILYPLKRVAGTDEFERISWDTALKIITGKLKYFKKEFGPQSILFYTGSGTKGLLNGVSHNFWRMFGGYTTTYGDLCWPAGLEATRLTLGDNRNSAPWDIENSKLIIMWGKNTAETNIHQMVFIEKAIEKGAKLIVIDPRRTQTSERADLLIQPRPGTDGALALAVANLLIKNGKTDDAFIKQNVLGFSEFKEMVSEYTPEKASEITDVPVEYIKKLAEYIGTIKPVTICAGFGMQRYTNSGQTMRALISLLAVTGNFGKPGAGWLFANLNSQIFDEVKDPIAFFPPEIPDGVVRISVSTAKLGMDMLAQENPPLKMIWVERGNPVSQNPGTGSVLEAFRKLDFRVVVEQFLTDTAREADIILPAKTMFEQTDVINAYWHDYIQIKQKVIEPPGEVKPETLIYFLLAERLGFPEEDIKKHIPGDDKAVESYLSEKLKPFPEITLEKLKEAPVLSPLHEEVAWSNFRFPTPSGKIELFSEEAADRWGVDPLPKFTEPAESVRKGDKVKKYPFYMMTPNTKNSIHSQFHNLEMIREVMPSPYITVNPADAKGKGISDGEKVRIFNAKGELKLKVKYDFCIKRGCIVVYNGWWLKDKGAVNFLSLERETDMAYGAAFHENLVDIEKL